MKKINLLLVAIGSIALLCGATCIKNKDKDGFKKVQAIETKEGDGANVSHTPHEAPRPVCATG